MSDAANVASIRTIEAFRLALCRFANEPARDALCAANSEIQNTEHWLESRVRHWNTEVDRWDAEVTQAEEELDDCERSACDDYVPDCSCFREHLDECRRRALEAREELATASHWQSAVQNATTKYELEASRLERMLSGDVPRAARLLARFIDTLDEYVLLSLPASAGLSQTDIRPDHSPHKTPKTSPSPAASTAPLPDDAPSPTVCPSPTNPPRLIIPASAVVHIFHGEMKKGRAQGFHHQGSIGHEGIAMVDPNSENPPATERTPDECYTATIRVRSNKGTWETKISRIHTFFPDGWSRNRVLAEIREAYNDAANTNAIKGSTWIGKSSTGIVIKGVTRGETLTTAYPIL